METPEFVERNRLVEHAEREFELCGWDMSDEMNQAVVQDVMELIRLFSSQGHSGMSAPYVAGMFAKLATYQILGELTGADDEWEYVADDGEEPLWQNKRDSRVFKNSKEAWQLDYYIFDDGDGTTYTSYCEDRNSKKIIESFPYTPGTKYVRVIDS